MMNMAQPPVVGPQQSEIFSSTTTIRLKTPPPSPTICCDKDEDGDDIVILRRDPATRKSYINKSAYLKLHRSLSAGNNNNNNNRCCVDNLKGKYESVTSDETVCARKTDDSDPVTCQLNVEQVEFLKTKYSPSSFGYQQTTTTTTTKVPVPKPRLSKENKPKDENSNILCRTNGDLDESCELSDDETCIVVRQTKSQESIDKIAKELSYFTMDKRGKEKKRTNSFKKLFTGGFFGKDKKKKEDERNRGKVYNDNIQNETNSFNRQSPHRHTIATSVQKGDVHIYANQNHDMQHEFISDERARDIERKYAEMHINRFNQIRQNFANQKTEDYVPMDNSYSKSNKKPSISDYISVPVKKYIDTSSSTSISEPDKQNTLDQIKESSLERKANYRENYRQTPPRAQETYQNFKLVKPKASIPINSERPLPNPYQNDSFEPKTTSPRTIERNLNKSNSKDYPNKSTNLPEKVHHPRLDETYGTVFDSLEYISSNNGEMKPVNLLQRDAKMPSSPLPPKSPSFESSKLKLPPNREIIDLQPRVKSPIPSNTVSTEKIIATELLRNSRSPTPPKKRNIPSPNQHHHHNNHLEAEIDYSNFVKTKPPISPKMPPPPPPRSQTDSPISSSDKITTSVEVHVPSPTRRSQTPVEVVEMRNRSFSPIKQPQSRSSTPVSPQKEDMRKSVEAYYWKELKKMKELEDYQLYMMQMSINGFAEDPSRVRRSRSLSPNTHRMGRRSLSLPREVKGQQQQQQQQFEYVDNTYGSRLRMLQQQPQPIPEDRPLRIPADNNRARRNLNYEPQYHQQKFVRNSSERRTTGGGGGSIGSKVNEYATDSLYRPIFRRGSLNRHDMMMEPQQSNGNNNKKVSFSSSSQNVRAWPTKNGFTLSPPQRRVDRRDGSLDDNDDDDVFLPNSSTNIDQTYGHVRRPERVVYTTKMLDPFYASMRQSNPLYEQTSSVRNYRLAESPQYLQRPHQMGPQRLSSTDSVNAVVAAPQPSNKGGGGGKPLQRREIVIEDEIYGQFGGYQQKSPNGLYASRQSIAESVYGRTAPAPKQMVTVTNKVCDMYGQIHESTSVPKMSGVLMGQLQHSPMTGRQNFVRGTRLTASANDMGRRRPPSNDPRYRSDLVYDPRYLPQQRYEEEVQQQTNYGPPTRPLPPVPNRKNFRIGLSDTESGSDASEVQRIMLDRGKSKKRGFFGK